MKKLLVLQMRPEDATAASEFEAILRVGEIDSHRVDRIRVEAASDIMPDLNNYFAIVAGGSPFDVSKPDAKKSQQQKDVETFFNQLFDKVFSQDFPFLGCCSGNGLLGNYCGTPISGTFAEPVGCTMIELTEAGKKDPLLADLPHTFRVMVGHKEACDSVPKGAVLLASSEECPVQMFRIKANIYATQFHPEADDKEFILRIQTYKDHGYFRPEEAEDLIQNIRDVSTPHSQEILKRFVMKYQQESRT